MNTWQGARELAMTLCDRSLCRVQVAAVVSDRRGIFAWGWNNHGPEGKGIHAECHALSRANPKRLCGATLTVAAKRKRNNKWVMAKPCQNSVSAMGPCMERAKRCGIKRVEFTLPDGLWATIELSQASD